MARKKIEVMEKEEVVDSPEVQVENDHQAEVPVGSGLLDEIPSDPGNVASHPEIIDPVVPPTPADPEWHDYVMGHFIPEELDPNGNPYTDALRRVVQKLMGCIVRAACETIQPPAPVNNFRAVVEFEGVVSTDGYEGQRVYRDVAEYPGDDGTIYARSATASAATKAEGRVWRKALGLRKIYSAEEIEGRRADNGFTQGNSPAVNSIISAAEPHQIKFIDKMCRDLSIDFTAFINDGRRRRKEADYADAGMIDQDTAKKMIDTLNLFQQDMSKIPPRVKSPKKEG